MYSLNLLPDERKRAIVLGRRLRQWRGATIVAIIGSCFSILSVVALQWTLNEQVKTSATTLASWQALSAKRESGQIKEVTSRLNLTLSELQGLFVPLSSAPTSPAELFAILPDEISLTTFTAQPDGRFQFSGLAATRSSFLALRTALESSTLITSVTTDSTASQRENLPFEYSGQFRLTP